jgi:uncharacterized phage infection (PIP) family protein YhgE
MEEKDLKLLYAIGPAVLGLGLAGIGLSISWSLLSRSLYKTIYSSLEYISDMGPINKKSTSDQIADCRIMVDEIRRGHKEMDKYLKDIRKRSEEKSGYYLDGRELTKEEYEAWCRKILEGLDRMEEDVDSLKKDQEERNKRIEDLKKDQKEWSDNLNKDIEYLKQQFKQHNENLDQTNSQLKTKIEQTNQLIAILEPETEQMTKDVEVIRKQVAVIDEIKYQNERMEVGNIILNKEIELYRGINDAISGVRRERRSSLISFGSEEELGVADCKEL